MQSAVDQNRMERPRQALFDPQEYGDNIWREEGD
jgi:hypothetical protein